MGRGSNGTVGRIPHDGIFAIVREVPAFYRTGWRFRGICLILHGN